MKPPKKICFTLILLFLLTFSVLLLLAHSFTTREITAAEAEAVLSSTMRVKTYIQTRSTWLLDYGKALAFQSVKPLQDLTIDPALGIDSLLFRITERNSFVFEKYLSGNSSPSLAMEIEATLKSLPAEKTGPACGLLSLPSGPIWIAAVKLDGEGGKTLILTQKFSSEGLEQMAEIPGLQLIARPAEGRILHTPSGIGTGTEERKRFGQATIKDMMGRPVFDLSFPLSPDLANKVNRQLIWWLFGMLGSLFPVLLATLISRISEHRYRSLFERSPVALWEEDFTAIREHLAKLRRLGVSDLAAYLDNHPEALEEISNLPRTREINSATVNLYGAKDKKDVLARLPQVFSREGKELLKREILAIARGDKTFEGEGINYSLDGRKLQVQIRWSISMDSNHCERVLLSVQDISGRKSIEDHLRFLSFHDPLTGINNRAFFEEEIRRLDSTKCDTLGVLTLDVDGLKFINDSLGHKAGDELLRRTGELLKRSFRSSDLLARIGGDEFVILLPSCDPKGLQSAMKRLKTEVLRDIPTLSCPTPLCFSVGWAWGSKDRPTVKELIARADQRMYAQKRQNRGRTLNHLSASVRKSLLKPSQNPASIKGLKKLLTMLQQATSATNQSIPALRN